MRKVGENHLKISENEKLYLDGVELRNVERYELCHSAGNTAELTVKLEVIVNQVASE